MTTILRFQKTPHSGNRQKPAFFVLENAVGVDARLSNLALNTEKKTVFKDILIRVDGV